MLEVDREWSLQASPSGYQGPERALNFYAKTALPVVEAVLCDGEIAALEGREDRVAAVGWAVVGIVGADPRVGVIHRMVGIGEDLAEP